MKKLHWEKQLQHRQSQAVKMYSQQLVPMEKTKKSDHDYLFAQKREALQMISMGLVAVMVMVVVVAVLSKYRRLRRKCSWVILA